MVRDWVTEQWPGLPNADVRLMAESVARIGFSHIVTPTAANRGHRPRSRTGGMPMPEIPDP